MDAGAKAKAIKAEPALRGSGHGVMLSYLSGNVKRHFLQEQVKRMKDNPPCREVKTSR